jgi:hypothetical protein
VNGPTVPIRVVSAKRLAFVQGFVAQLEKYALSLVLPDPLIVALYIVRKLGFAGLKLMSLNWTSNECRSQAPPATQVAVSEVRSSPYGTSLGE